jgi:CHAD domain-containing protein
MPIAPERSKLLFQKAERDLMRLSSAQEGENVHRFRTTTRRLQTLIEQFVSHRGRNQRKLLKILDPIRKRAGKVRDLDMQLAALRSLKIPQEPRRKTQLVQELIELRAKREKKLRKLLTQQAIQGIRNRLRRASGEVTLDARLDPLAVARKMLAQVARPSGPLTEDVLHQYRTVVKRARYAAEFGPKSAEGAQLIAQLKRLQDAVGSWHDWLTLTHNAAERLGGVNQSSLVAVLYNVTGGKFRQAVAALSASLVLQTKPKAEIQASENLLNLGAKSPAPIDRTESAA